MTHQPEDTTPLESYLYSKVGLESFPEPLMTFLNQELRPKEDFSIRNEYPSFFGAYPGGESLYIRHEEKVVSHVGILAREFQYQDWRLKVGLIGSVATDYQFRGRGYASSLLREALSRLKRKGCSVALLWSDKTDFYFPLGFYRAGREIDLVFDPATAPEIGVEAQEGVNDADIHFLWRLYHKHPGRLDRSLEEMKVLCKIPKVRMFVTRANGQITSYLAIHKGADFKNFIHEWGGDPQAVRDNLAYCQRHFFKADKLTLIAPPYEDLAWLDTIAENRYRGVLGLMKVLDRASLLATYVKFLQSQNLVGQWKRDLLTFQIGNQNFPLSTDQECLQLVFGNEAEPDHPVLPFFLWGFDSI